MERARGDWDDEFPKDVELLEPEDAVAEFELGLSVVECMAISPSECGELT